jgi:hypothetical protein
MSFTAGTGTAPDAVPTLTAPTVPTVAAPTAATAPTLAALSTITSPYAPTFTSVSLSYTGPSFSTQLASIAAAFPVLYTTDETALLARIASEYDLELQRRQTAVINQTAGRGWNFLPGAADTLLEEFTVDANRQSLQMLAELAATKDKVAFESAKQQVEFALGLMQVKLAENETALKVAMAQIDMDKTIAMVNVENFKAKIMYSGYELSLAQLEVEKFKANVQQVMHAIDVELAKVEIYKGELSLELGAVQLYSGKAEALRAYNSIVLGNMQMQNETNRNLLTAYTADLEAYKANLAKEMVEFDSYSKAYPAEVQAWATVAGAHAETMRVEVANIDAMNRLALAEKELILKKAEFEQDLVTKKQGLQVEITRFGLATSQQLIASALNSLNVSAQFSFSSQYGESASINESESFNYEMAAPTA